MCLTSGFVVLPLCYVLNLSLVFDILMYFAMAFYSWTDMKRRDSGSLSLSLSLSLSFSLSRYETEVFRHIIWVCQLFVLEVKQRDKYFS